VFWGALLSVSAWSSRGGAMIGSGGVGGAMVVEVQ